MWYKGSVFILASVLWGHLYLEIKLSNMHTYESQIYILQQEQKKEISLGTNSEYSKYAPF